jgi:hypothetical protein
MTLDDLITYICDNFDLDEVIERLEDVLAEYEECWSDEDLEYEVDNEGFHFLI